MVELGQETNRMIKVTRLDNKEFTVNADMIELIESIPETILSMSTGKKIVVREPVDEVVRRIVEYRHRVLPVIKPAPN
jgi:flagellar protein FlbD